MHRIVFDNALERAMHAMRFRPVFAGVFASRDNTCMDTVHRFDGRIDDYDRYRERYAPEVLLPILHERCGLTPSWQIADIGAGTGMLADVFLANGNHVFAVEPNAGMRARCVELHTHQPITVFDGTAEHTGLGENSVDLVSVGRAMHWFHLERSMQEFRRILRHDGRVAIIAFGRTERGHLQNEEVEQLLRRFSPTHEDTHATYTIYKELREHIPRDYHHQQIHSMLELSWERLLGLVLSLSSAPRRSDASFPAFEQALREIFLRYQRDDLFEMEMRYWINLGRFA